MTAATPEAKLLVDEAKLVLGRLSSTSPDAARRVREARDAIEREWGETATVVGIGGTDVPARSVLLDVLCGGGLLDGVARVPGCAAVRVARGDDPAPTFRAVADDGAVEEGAIPDGRPSPARRAELENGISSARIELIERESAAAAADREVPALVKVTPRPWTFWLWPMRWIARWMSRRKLAARERADALVGGIKNRLASLEAAIRQLDVEAARDRTRHVDRVRELCSGVNAGAGVRELAVRVAGPLPLGVEAVELTGWSTAPPPTIDGVLAVSRPHSLAPPPPPGKLALPGLLDALPGLLVDARAARLGGAARDAVDAAVDALDAEIAKQTAELDGRIERLQALRIGDPAMFAAAHVTRVKPQIIASVHAVMEHASTHLGSELAQLAASWTSAIQGAGSGDALKAAVAKIDEQSPAELQRIAEEVRMLVHGGVGGSAHDLVPEVTAGLKAHLQADAGDGAPRKRSVPAVAAVAILPSLANPVGSKLGGAGWLTGLFRSLDARRADLLVKAQQRADHVRDVATSELLDAEPQLNAALQGALAAELDAAIQRQVAWLGERMVKEVAAVDRDRAALAPLERARERARRDARRLTDMLAPITSRLRVAVRHTTGDTAIDVAFELPDPDLDLDHSTGEHRSRVRS